MNALATPWWPIGAATGATVGLLLGVVYFMHIRSMAERYVSGAPPWHAAAATLARICCAGVTFFLLTRWSAAAAICGLAGFTVARQWVVAGKGLG